MNNMFILILGPTASGKTTIEHQLRSMGFTSACSYTTRQKRDSEINGVDYNFISVKDFQNTNFIASYKINDSWMYGLTKEETEGKKLFSCISEDYAKQLNDVENLVIINFNIPQEVRYKRLLLRGESEESILKRFEIEEKEGKINLNIFNLDDRFILNIDESTSEEENLDLIMKFLRGLE